MKLSKDSLKTEQLLAIDRLSTRRSTILIAPTGAGKTVTCLSAINEIKSKSKLNRVIVACPPKVVSVWPTEVAKWDHLKGLRVSTLLGDAPQRSMKLAIASDVIVVSLNNLEWLLKQDHGCDGIIIDELSKAAGKQTSGLRTKVRGDCFIWRVGMTATPVSQDFEKIFSMCRIIDKGKRLGTNRSNYLDRYFYSDYMGWNWTLKKDADKQIMSTISTLVHIIDDTKEKDLPAIERNTITFDMPDKSRVIYNKMKKDMVADDYEADAANEAVKSGKLRQIASGFLYTDDVNQKKANHIDDARIDAAVDWWFDVANKRPAVIFYEFVAQGEKLNKVFHKYASDNIEAFILGRGTLLIAQINSLSHGVDGLQYVTNDALFYHPMWSRDAMEQAEGRLWRTGANEKVNITTLICPNTLDDLVMKRVEDRAEWMKMFKKHLGAK
jgi:superfamily II DNA or RNA helicase|tara:strand:+ start:734 stop:2050 length:1317 start_codon:yes stop_codon:yes gene_type:complete